MALLRDCESFPALSDSIPPCQALSQDSLWRSFGLKAGQCLKLKKLLKAHDEETMVDQVSNSLQQIIALPGFLRDMVVDLFSSVENFARAVLGLPPSEDYSICNSIEKQRRWLDSHGVHAECKKVKESIMKKKPTEKSCSDMRRYMRQVLLLAHPDKFRLLHPKCPPGSSDQLAAELNGEYFKLKESCREFSTSNRQTFDADESRDAS